MQAKRPLYLSNTILLLGIISLFGDIASEMIYPVLPVFIVANLGASPLAIGIIEGFCDGFAQVFKFVVGVLSERHSKKRPFIITGYALSAIGKGFIGFSSAWSGVFLLRFLDRFGKGLRTAPRDSLIAEVSKESERSEAYSIHRSLDSLGAFLGPLLALSLLPLFYRDPKTFFLIALIPASASVLLVLFVKKDEVQAKKEFGKLSFSHLPKSAWQFLAIWTIFCFCNSSDAFLLLNLNRHGHKLETVIGLYALYNLVFSLSAILFGRRADRNGRVQVMILGLSFFTLSYIGFIFTEQVAIFAILFALYGLYAGATDGIAKSIFSTMVTTKDKSSSLGLFAGLTGLATFFSNIMAGLIWKYFSPTYVFIIGGIGAFVAIVSLSLFQVRQKKHITLQ